MPDLTDAIARIVGPTGILTGADAEPYCEDWRRLYQGRTPAVIRPANTEEVAEVVRLCAEAGAPIVPQGGNTSMVGGATPAETAARSCSACAAEPGARDRSGRPDDDASRPASR